MFFNKKDNKEPEKEKAEQPKESAPEGEAKKAE